MTAEEPGTTSNGTFHDQLETDTQIAGITGTNVVDGRADLIQNLERFEQSRICFGRRESS